MPASVLDESHVSRAPVEMAHRIYDRESEDFLYLQTYGTDALIISNTPLPGGVLVTDWRESTRYVPVRLTGLEE